MNEETVLSGLKPDEVMARGALAEAGSGDFSCWVPPEVDELERIVTGYKVQGMIAKGGMGAVYNVTQKDLNRVCALKLLPLEVSEEPGFEDRFILEARAMASLNHPNIMTIYDFGRTSEGHVYYVMEFVDGMDLSELIKLDSLEETKAMEIMMQVCDALEFAHEGGVVHRDVKPANIMIDKLGRVKVTDFGLAKLLKSEPSLGTTTVGQVMGTPDYMAPEQSTGVSVDHRADIYALGVVLYELLTGTLPKGIFAPPSKKAQVDVKYDDVVIMAMQQEPELRFQKVSDVKMSIQEAHESCISKARKSKSKKKNSSKLNASDIKAWSNSAEGDERSGSGLNLILGLAAVGLIGIGGFWYYQNSGESSPVTNPVVAAVGDSDAANKIDPLFDDSIITPVEDVILNLNRAEAELNGVVLDVKSSRYYLKMQQQNEADARMKAQEAEGNERAEAIEIARRASEKRAEAFKMTQNSQLGIQLTAGGTNIEDDFFKKVDKGLLELDAEGGNVDAQFLLGRIYQLGKGVAPSQETSDRWYKMASAQGHEGAQKIYKEKLFDVGLKHYHGDGVPQDYGKAIESFKQAAERGNVLAMNLLGWMCDSGEGVEKNSVQAVTWYRKAAELGYVSAQFNLAECYRDGLGVTKDLKEAVQWYSKAAEQGNKLALPHLGNYYREALEKGIDTDEAVKWIRIAAENGDAASQCDLGKLYVIGKGVKRDPKLAVSWLRKSAEQEYARAEHNLGLCYENGIGVNISNSDALKWYKKAVAKEHPEAHRELGNMYAFAKGVKKDTKKAVSLYLKAAEYGVVESQFNMGVCYAKGIGISKSSTLAVKWFRAAADQGYAKAQYNLGKCYAEGLGVSKSKNSAKLWFKKASDAGNEDAKNALKKLR